MSAASLDVTAVTIPSVPFVVLGHNARIRSAGPPAARRRRGEATAAAVSNLLAKWERVVDARPVVSLDEAFEDALWRRTFVDEMAEALFRVFEQSPWFDDITTLDRHESRDESFLLAARFDYPLGGVAFPLAWFFNRGPVAHSVTPV